MHESGFKRWGVWGVLAWVSWLIPACQALPQQPGNETYAPGFVRDPAQAGYNGTIQQLPTSIDPRTPEAAGIPGRTLRMDRGAQALLEVQERGSGGSGAGGGMLAPSRARPGSESGDSGPSPLLRGARGTSPAGRGDQP